MINSIYRIFGKEFINELKAKVSNKPEDLQNNLRSVYTFLISEEANNFLLEHQISRNLRSYDTKGCRLLVDLCLGLFSIPFVYFSLSFLGEVILIVEKVGKNKPNNINFFKIILLEVFLGIKNKSNRRLIYLFSKYRQLPNDLFKERTHHFWTNVKKHLTTESKKNDNKYSIFQLKRDIVDILDETLPTNTSNFYEVALIFSLSHQKNINNFLDHQKIEYGDDFCEFLMGLIQKDKNNIFSILDENKYTRVRQWIGANGYHENIILKDKPSDFKEILLAKNIDYINSFSFLYKEEIGGETFLTATQFDTLFQFGFGYSISKPQNIKINKSNLRKLSLIYKFVFEFYNLHGKAKEKTEFANFLKYNFVQFRDNDIESALRGHVVKYPFEIGKYIN